MGLLDGKVAIVTGANSGIGREVSRVFAREGATVIVSDVAESPGADGWEDAGLTTVEAIQKSGGSAAFLRLDVSDEQAFTDAVAGTVATHGRLDVVVNNAGVLRAGARLHEYTAADLDFCHAVNTRGAFNGTMAPIRHWLSHEQAGLVLNTVSTAGINPFRNEGPYALTKAAAAMLVRNVTTSRG